jgi:pimeloyl-ACP methyl ester carboxylesterase
MTMERRAISADGIPLAFDIRGSGAPTLVFVHGWSCDRSYWRGQVDDLAREFQVVTVDLAGHGASGAGRQGWTMAAFGGDVVAIADELGLTEMVLVGHSMGGDVIVEAAGGLGDRIVGLVWVDVYRALGGEPDTDEELDAFTAPFVSDFAPATRAFTREMFRPETDADLVDWVVADMSSAPPELALEALRNAMSAEPATVAGLAAIDAPKVTINPDYRSTDVESLRRHGVETIVMPGSGHFLMLEHPATFNGILRQVVARFTAPG